MPTQEEPSPSEQFQSVFREALPLDTKLERARTELLDLSARNRLLNLPRSAKSARSITVIDEKSVETYRLLVKEGKAFTFLPGREAITSEEAEPSEEAELDEISELAQPEDNSMDERGVFARHSDTRLQTRLTSQALQKRLLELYTDASTLEQEQGVNILYLALGTLKWIDPKDAGLVRYAPLILVPVALERGTAAERFKLKARAEDVSSNLSLEAYLDRIHKIRLPECDVTDDFDPSLYMRSVADAVKSKEGWEVCEDDIVLGFFSFAKFLMYRDLDPECWPWQRSYRRLFTLTNIMKPDKRKKRCHPHMFRDTFAVEMLLAGVPIDQVSILLGHSSVKITERNYAPFVKARQIQLQESVRAAWKIDAFTHS